MDVGQRPEELVDVQLDLQHGHRSLEFVEVTGCTVNSLWDILENEVEVDFIFLKDFEIPVSPRERGNEGRKGRSRGDTPGEKKEYRIKKRTTSITYPVTVGVVKGFQFDDVGMAHNPHDLQFTILEVVSC